MDRTEGGQKVEWIVVNGSGEVQGTFSTPREASQFIGQMYDEGYQGDLSVARSEGGH